MTQYIRLCTSQDDPLGVWVKEYGRFKLEGASAGPLVGTYFAVKDSMSISGIPTGLGNPAFLRENRIPNATDDTVRRCLDSGATLLGKTQMDEFAWSLNGANFHYGAPVNPAAANRLCGGSSSGSAAVVAGNLVSFALGSDGGGSMRTPASYTGILGIRPSYGRTYPNRKGVPRSSTTTLGWFAKDPDLFATLGSVVLQSWSKPGKPGQVYIAKDLWDATDEGVAQSCLSSISNIESFLGKAEPINISEGRLSEWSAAFTYIHNSEFWARLGEWYKKSDADAGEDIAHRFERAAKQPKALVDAALDVRNDIRSHLWKVLANNAVMIAPSAAGPAPLRSSSLAELEARREKALQIMCPAGHAQLCQVSLPLASVEGAPMGVSLIAAPGNDEMLLDIARQIMS